MAKKTGGRTGSLAQLAASLDTKKRPLPPELQVSAAEARALLKAGKAPVEADAVPRAAALTSLAAAPPSKRPTKGRAKRGDGSPWRVRLMPVDRSGPAIEVTVSPRHVSVGGLFVRTKVPPPLGTRMTVTFLPSKGGSEVRVRGEVVCIERSASKEPAVALRFTEYLDGAEDALASQLMAPVLHDFVAAYARTRAVASSGDFVARAVDLLTAWELRKAEQGGDVWELGEE